MKGREIDTELDETVEFAEIGRVHDIPVKRKSSGMYVCQACRMAERVETVILLVAHGLAVGDAAFLRMC